MYIGQLTTELGQKNDFGLSWRFSRPWPWSVTLQGHCNGTMERFWSLFELNGAILGNGLTYGQTVSPKIVPVCSNRRRVKTFSRFLPSSPFQPLGLGIRVSYVPSILEHLKQKSVHQEILYAGFLSIRCKATASPLQPQTIDASETERNRGGGDSQKFLSQT